MGSLLKGKETTTQTYPQWYEDLMRNTAALGARSASVGPMSWMGPTVAAMSPGETAARSNVDAMLAAFGLGGRGEGAYLPPPTSFAGGVQGYSSYPLQQGAFGQLPQWQQALYNGLWGPGGAFAQAAGAYTGGAAPGGAAGAGSKGGSWSPGAPDTPTGNAPDFLGGANDAGYADKGFSWDGPSYSTDGVGQDYSPDFGWGGLY